VQQKGSLERPRCPCKMIEGPAWLVRALDTGEAAGRLAAEPERGGNAKCHDGGWSQIDRGEGEQKRAD
jgi:hypothetical protein